MPVFVEGAVPQIMGSVLPTLTGNYQARRAIQPATSHDFSATRGKFVQIDRFKTWGERGLTKLARARDKTQIIGTANAEGMEKSSRIVQLQEFTGPSTESGEPSSLHLTREDILYARNRLWDYGLVAFHQSIGSMNLADDFARSDDRFLVEELMRCRFKYNPGAKADTNVVATDRISRNDILRVRELLATYNTPRFPDGTYHWEVSERQFRHLSEDPQFYSFALAVIQGSNPMGASPAVFGNAGQGMMATGTGPVMQAQPLPPVVYEGFTFFCTNTLPTRVVTTTGGQLVAHLGFAFGPGTVGVATGGKGPQVKLNSQTDYDRHFHFIWQLDGQYTYMLDDDQFSGICVEVRTYDV